MQHVFQAVFVFIYKRWQTATRTAAVVKFD